MATKNKAAAKKGAATKGSAKAKGPAEPSAAARKAQAEAQTPIEAIGPGVEHEDHEGGITDSLAKKGVRAPLPTAEELADAADEETKTVRAPSVRERQTGLGAVIARGGFRGVRDTVDAKGNVVARPRGAFQVLAARDGTKVVPVIATRLGQYPADGRLRAPGEAFDYVMLPTEDKLPSWVEDPTGEIESRQPGETIGVEPATATITVRGASADNVSVSAGPGAGNTAAANRANRSKAVI